MCKLFDVEKNCFSTEAKALNFIKQFEEEILSKKGYAPVRAYYDENINAWQVTSRYNVSPEYVKGIVSFYEKTTHNYLPNIHTDLQFSKHTENAMLFYIDTQICEVAKLMKNCSDKEEITNIIKEIRVAHSQCAYKKEMRNDDHKTKITQFIAFWCNWNNGNISDTIARPKIEKSLRLFSKKRDSFFKKQYDDNEEVLQTKELLSLCIRNITDAYNFHNNGKVSKGMACLEEAREILVRIPQNTKLSYKKKRIRAILDDVYNTMCLGIA